MRTDGAPSVVAVASAAASGSSRPAARASASHSPSVVSGSGVEALEPGVHRPECTVGRLGYAARRWRRRRRSRSARRSQAPARVRSLSARCVWSRIRSSCTCRSSPSGRENATITDVDGNVFVDFAGGVGVVNAGHGHPRVIDAVVEQAAAVPPHRLHGRPLRDATSSSRSGCARSCRSRGRRVRPSSTRGPRRSRTPSSSRACTPSRPAVIAFEGAFHGRTLLSMTMTSKFHPYKTGMGPYAPEVYRAPYPERLSRAERRGGAGSGSSGCSRRTSPPDARRGDRVRAAARRGRVRPCAAARTSRGCARSATATGSSSSRTRCRPGSAAPAACSRWSTSASSRPHHRGEVDRRRACRSRA